MIRMAGDYPWGPRKKHRFKIDHVSTYAVHYKCQKCPTILVIDKFQLRSWVKGTEVVAEGLRRWSGRCSR